MFLNQFRPCGHVPLPGVKRRSATQRGERDSVIAPSIDRRVGKLGLMSGSHSIIVHCPFSIHQLF